MIYPISRRQILRKKHLADQDDHEMPARVGTSDVSDVSVPDGHARPDDGAAKSKPPIGDTDDPV